MIPSPNHRLVPCSPATLSARLARRGARAFQVRGGDDLLVTLPEVVGPVLVLAPRGHGWPLLARRVHGALRAEPHGAPCSPARWSAAGGLAAVGRRVDLPAAPARAELGPALPAGPRDGFLCIRPQDLAWSALRRDDPSAGHGAVVLGSSTVRAVSPAARARGISSGMSLRAVRRRWPGVDVRPAVSGVGLGLELGAWLDAEFGGARRVAGGWLVPWPVTGRPGTVLVGEAAALTRRIWQHLGVQVRIAAGESEAAARGLAACLEVGQVAAAEPQATRAWERASEPGQWAVSTRRARWAGPPVPDVEGAVALGRALAASLAREAEGQALHLTVTGERTTARVLVPVPAGADRALVASLVESRLRAVLPAAGPVAGVAAAIHAGRWTRGGASGGRAAAAGAR